MRLVVAVVVFMSSASLAHAEARTLRFERSWSNDPLNFAVWKDKLSEAPEPVWNAFVGPFRVTILRGEARVYDPYVEVYAGPACPDLTTQTIDLVTRTWTACDRALVLPVGQGDE